MPPRLTLHEYLELEDKAEFYNGEVFAMAGGTPAHGQLASSFTIVVGSQLRPKGCTSSAAMSGLPSALLDCIPTPTYRLYAGDRSSHRTIRML